ncbi:hypothetical protein BOX15_Mlig001465g1, partial [Macrostomum lignano]
VLSEHLISATQLTMPLPPLHVRTPLIESRPLTEALGRPGCRVWLKLENCQPTGSFKIRGIGCMVQRALLADKGCSQVVSSSGGNAGLAAAYAAAHSGLPCTVVVPSSTPESMRKRVSAEGAQVLVHGSVWRDAHAKAEELVSATPNSLLVHPYDHPDIWDGHGTLVDEILEPGSGLSSPPSAIVVAVGGGGLLCGIARAFQRRGLYPNLIAAETVGANCLSVAMATGHPVTLPGITSKATSLGASQICSSTWTTVQEFGDKASCVVCTDAEAAVASWRFLEDHHMLTETACGAALSVVYNSRVPETALSNGGDIVVVVCGGRNVTVSQLSELAGLDS